MTFLWKSVVGKLWMTIIGLVTVVLFILALLLVQFFDRYYYDHHYELLKDMAGRVSVIFESYTNPTYALASAKELVELTKTSLTIIDTEADQIWQVAVSNRETHTINPQIFLEDVELQKVFQGETVSKRGIVSKEHGIGEEQDLADGIVVGVPYIINNQQRGALYVYQDLAIVSEALDEAKKIIVYAASLGFLLTTIFAFFLSTRITKPLRQMKQAATQIAKGDFKSKVSIRSTDEIGELARAFNHMGSQLKDSIHALSQEKEQVHSILRSMVDGVISLNRTGDIMITNPPAETMLNAWRYEENVTDETLLPTPVLNIFREVVKTEREQVGFITAQGRYWTVLMSPLYNHDTFRGAVAVIRDMTEEQKLDKLRKDFIANVSHELRTPLAMMQGYSEALLDDIVETKEERAELTKVIYDESLRMGRLVNELLDLARMEAMHVELNLTPITIHDLLKKVIKKFSNLAKENQVNLNAFIPPSDDLYLVDPDRLEQIFTNLLDNAIRHTAAGGEVVLRAQEIGANLSITVADTGTGIPEEDLPFVFERFYKADKARTRGSNKGTGLGLAIVKHLVDAHRGEISVRSRLGEGTSFTVTLPRFEGEQT